MYLLKYFQHSETFNFSLRPQIAHILETALLTFAIHTLDRQTDYMNRLTHLLNKKVELEQQEADKLQAVSRNLLLNILPKHVGKTWCICLCTNKTIIFLRNIYTVWSKTMDLLQIELFMTWTIDILNLNFIIAGIIFFSIFSPSWLYS